MATTHGSLETLVLEQAAKDPQFRERLKQDPAGTIARDFGVQVPSDISIQVVEEMPSKVYLVLPPAPAQRGQELTSAELETVAGGWTGRTDACDYCTNNGFTCPAPEGYCT